MSTPLWDALREAGGRRPEGTALVSLGSGRVWDFRQLIGAIEERSAALAAAGVQAGSRAVLALPNSGEFVILFYALARLGATVFLVSPRYGTSEVASVRDQAQPDLWVVPSPLPPGYAPLEEGPPVCPRLPLVQGVDLLVEQGRGPSIAPDDQDAVVKFTSGSTGEPKGIRLGGTELLAEAAQVSATLGLSAADRTLAIVPLFHSYGFDLGVLATLLSGATLTIGDALALPILMRELGRGAHSVFLGVPITYRVLIESDADLDLSATRWLLSCTAPLAPATIARFHDRFRAPICQHYGSSETGALTNHLPEEALRRPESVGRPLHGVTIRVLDPEGRDCPKEVEGEVVAESAAIARGYLRQGAGISPFRDGRYYTGDLGVLDDDGFLTLRGRVDHVINVGGFKVSPTEVARVLEEHPAVREAAAYGAPGRSGEVVVHAMVALAHPAREEDLLLHCRGRLADYKVPRRIEIRDRLPVGPTGKLRLP